MELRKINCGTRRRPAAGIVGACVLSIAMLAACANIKIRAGRKVDLGQLQQLTVGQSTAGDVRRKLGEPYGSGRSYLPHQNKHVDVWTYYHELGTLKDIRRTFLFVYLDHGVYDGHMWFSSLPDSHR